MTPKEKAEELFEKYFNIIDNSHPLTDINISAKQCAFIAVDEILKDREEIDGMRVINDPYWSKVKQEIEKL